MSPSALVVDDQPSTLMLVSAILMRAGYRVSEYTTGQSALQALCEDNYDLVILDINLPDCSGIDVLRNVRLHSRHLPPIIGITAAPTREVKEAALAAGMCLVLEKPISYRQLIDAATLAVNVRQSMRRDEAALPVVDAVVLSTVAAVGGPELWQNLVHQSVLDAQRCLADLRECAATADLPNWRRHAHTLNGIALTVGGRRLSNAIDAAMHTSDERLARTAAGLVTRFSELLDELQGALHEWLAKGGVNAPRPRRQYPEARLQADLSDEEISVLRWTAAGKTAGEVAAILGVSTRAVSSHVAASLAKLDAENKTQAVVKAVMLGFLSLDDVQRRAP